MRPIEGVVLIGANDYHVLIAFWVFWEAHIVGDIPASLRNTDGMLTLLIRDGAIGNAIAGHPVWRVYRCIGEMTIDEKVVVYSHSFRRPCSDPIRLQGGVQVIHLELSIAIGVEAFHKRQHSCEGVLLGG